MAYYDDAYMWPQQHTAYNDLVTYQDSVSFSGNYESYNDLNYSYDAYAISEFHDEPNFVENYHCYAHDYNYEYDYDYDLYPPPNPEIKYLEYNYAEPKLIAYEPVACDTGYISYHTEYSISYTQVNSGFNEPEFEEYDPTPYDGGFDIVSVYGKPLPPSDKTCYPRSKPIEPKPRPNPQPEPISIPTPVPVVVSKPEPEHQPKSKPELESVHVPVLMPPPKALPTPVPVVEPEPEPEPEPVHVHVPMHEPIGETQREESYNPNYGYDYPWPEYDNYGYGIGVGYDYGYGKQMVQVPPIEYDSQVVDLCENIFGSWPCLARIRKQQMAINNNNSGITCDPRRHHDPLEECANYIFGSPITSCNH